MSLSIVIAGGGIGGLAVALALSRLGHKVVVFEQATQFGRVGADVNLTPNAVRALDGLGLGAALRETAARPTHRISRTWDSGAITSMLAMGRDAEQRYGAPQLTIHRADLLAALDRALPDGVVRHDQRVLALANDDDGPALVLASGERVTADVVIGADGIHSVIRAGLFGPDAPLFTGTVAYRAVVPRDRLTVPHLDAFTKWWGPVATSQIVTFPLTRHEETFVFATAAQDDWRHESWTRPGDLASLKPLYGGYHPEARALLEACETMMASALYIREPLSCWSVGHTTLIGDACHPMMPFMAQGACQTIEDTIVLARCLDGATRQDVSAALVRYESARRERTARIQIGSRGNEWLRDGGNADWVYGYDAWKVALP